MSTLSPEVSHLTSFPLARLPGDHDMLGNVQLKVEDHAELTPFGAYTLDDFVGLVDARHLTDAECVVLPEDGAKLAKILVQPRAGNIVLGALAIRKAGIGEPLVLANEVDHVEAEAVAAS